MHVSSSAVSAAAPLVALSHLSTPFFRLFISFFHSPTLPIHHSLFSRLRSRPRRTWKPPWCIPAGRADPTAFGRMSDGFGVESYFCSGPNLPPGRARGGDTDRLRFGNRSLFIRHLSLLYFPIFLYLSLVLPNKCNIGATYVRLCANMCF